MAQWSHGSKTVYAKLVYFGPAVGGKTTNLQKVHELTDPGRTTKLLSVRTSDDRTLFFDLLPFELGAIAGYSVALKVYTVPGQVRYEATRRLVLSGADAVVFVADSDPSREAENRGSLESLRVNMKVNGLDPASVPVVFQFNKQDLPGAAPPRRVAEWLGIELERGIPAVAIQGRGVLETFAAATGALLARLLGVTAGRAGVRASDAEIRAMVQRALQPKVPAASERGNPTASTPGVDSIVPSGKDLLEQSLQTNVTLGDALSGERRRSERLTKEVEALRRLSDILRRVGASFDHETIVDAALEASTACLGAVGTALLRISPDGGIEIDRTHGSGAQPLLALSKGPALAARLVTMSPLALDDLASIGGATEGPTSIRAAGSAPVDPGKSALVALLGGSATRFADEDLRFLGTVAGHLAAGLEKAEHHEELSRRNEALEDAVRRRTEELEKANTELRELDRMKDRFLSSLSHEMRTPLTAIVGAATYLRDYDGSGPERVELLGSILSASRRLDELMEGIFRLVRLERGEVPFDIQEVDPLELAEKAKIIADCERAVVRASGGLGRPRADRAQVSRALANLLDNARKFSPPESPIEVTVASVRIKRRGRVEDGVSFSVLDRGAGISPVESERLLAPFEQGGDPLTGKPAGFGTGLHEARLIASRHGGGLRLYPREGGGSEVRLILPLEPPLPETDRA